MTAFLPELFGGALIGLAASVMLLFNGRIAGISGVFSGLLKPRAGDIAWRAAFVGGLVFAGAVAWFLAPASLEVSGVRSPGTVAVAGLLVGLGVRMGNGCTSGHGVCGLSRMSRRSVVATLSFMGAGMVTATAIQLLTGGVL